MNRTLGKAMLSPRRILVVIAVSLIVLLGTVNVADAKGSISQKGSFAVYITGLPNTGYYVWLTGTFDMSGVPGDQPPVIASGQENIRQDPDGGPYTIGSYQINNQNGRTILDDVAASAQGYPNTNYYALVTTDVNGQAVVAFRTSPNTAVRKYSVKVENSQSVNSNNLLVQTRITSGEILPTIPPPTTALPTPSPVATTLPPTATVIVPVTSFAPPTTTPARAVPIGITISIIAIAVGGILVRKK